MTPRPVLTVANLSLAIGGTRLTDDVSLSIAAGEILGIVGESGCGKSVTALAIARLLPEPIRIAGGSIMFDGHDLARATARDMSAIRGSAIGMIFQEPMTSLNPVFTIGDQIAEPMILHRGLRKPAARARAAELLKLVGIPAPGPMLERYPHQVSGGQRQRVMIAMAVACEPRLLIADEPTTALDVTVQAQVLALIDKLRTELGLACLLITHDLGVVSGICDRAMVMYSGRIVEEAPVRELLAAPRHRYTRALLDTMPARNPPGTRLPTIAGQVPPPGARGPGCVFAARCQAVREICAIEVPPMVRSGDRSVACWNPVP